VNLYNIFPTTVGMFDLDRTLTESELKCILGQEQRPNMGNATSVNNYLLKEKKLSKLHDFLNSSVNKYLEEIYKPKNDVSLYITQSWANYTEQGQFHHKHAHPNSFISGVFYVQSDNAKDRIYFYKDGYSQLKVPPKEWNLYNSDSWWFEAITGRLVLFPSSLTHMVVAVESEKTRVSLSFNTFLKGYVGSEDELTGLRLGD
jgi:uncharacterized protein (TIGR02466 family)